PAKRYGNIYSMWIGPHILVVLSGFKTVKEVMTSFPRELSDQPENAYLTAIGKKRGIIFSNGHTWKQQRHIGLTSLRKLGLGKKSIEHQIEDAAQTLIEAFRQTKGQPFDPSLPVTHAASNAICALSFGHQFHPQDENFQKLIQAFHIILNFTSCLFHINVLASVQMINSFAKQEIEKHKESSCLHEPQDFIDHYLLQMEKSRNNPNSTYNEENLAQCIFDFFGAGTETVFTTLMWALLLLTNHPDIQEKVQKEIEDVFGLSRPISYQDQKKLPYTNAMIHEAAVNFYFAWEPQLERHILHAAFHESQHRCKAVSSNPDRKLSLRSQTHLQSLSGLSRGKKMMEIETLFYSFKPVAPNVLQRIRLFPSSYCQFLGSNSRFAAPVGPPMAVAISLAFMPLLAPDHLTESSKSMSDL
ncbi:cytochrome P450 2J2-like, partial [Protobothrops mucrosquamatus]|uniref:cytochrome P450 2J2-like n=1 Tax=Protobothrops mucrosquamatus TaxID=103944 RepID=UPI0010FB12E2